MAAAWARPQASQAANSCVCAARGTAFGFTPRGSHRRQVVGQRASMGDSTFRAVGQVLRRGGGCHTDGPRQCYGRVTPSTTLNLGMDSRP